MYCDAFHLDPDRVFHTTPVRRLYYWLESRMDRLTRESEARKAAQPGSGGTGQSYNDADLMALLEKDRVRRG